MTDNHAISSPQTVLVGAGIVGCAILQAHLDASVPVCLVDQDPARLQEAAQRALLSSPRWRFESVAPLGGQLPMLRFLPRCATTDEPPYAVVIESISERIEVKKSFFALVEQWFGSEALLCTNTSTLLVGNLSAALNHPERFCGMHFFMPVTNRPAVEIARGQQTSSQTIDRCIGHVRRLRKEPLVVRDGPGFIVNRMLAPYLNEAMLLLCRGIDAHRIEQAALDYGMPMSPLELIDWIGTRTMFDAGRVFWQSYPQRLRPAALLAALIKNGRFGRAVGAGFYDYPGGQRSELLSPVLLPMVDRYRRDEMVLSDDEVRRLLAIPMWIEAALARREGVVGSSGELDLAMRGGLGFDPQRSWLGFFDQLGSDAILDSMQAWSDLTPAMHAPRDLHRLLNQLSPSAALEAFASNAEL